MRDDGAFCKKPESYGRGAGSITECKDCEKWGLLWYPKCKPNFHNVACCVCSPDCPAGMTDIGISCAKKSYGRTAGKPLGCAKGLELSGALCYPPCPEGANGIGPVCWGSCPQGTTKCGALCLSPDTTCAQAIGSIAQDVFELIIDGLIGDT